MSFPAITTLTSICEDTLNSTIFEKTELKPFNKQLINEEYLNKIPVNFDENVSLLNLKQLFRTTHLHIAHPLRSSLWINLLRQDQKYQQYKFQQAIERYPEDIRNMFGRRNDITVRLPSCIDLDHLPNYNLNRKGQHARTRILSVFAYYHPDITWAPLLAPLTALFLHYMTEIDAYESLLILTNNNYKIITQTEIQYQSLILAFRSLLRRHYRSTYDILMKYQQNILDNWLWIIFEYLPLKYLVPIIDCLLIEDMKILIRFTISLLNFFVKYISKQHIKPKRRYSIFRRETFSRLSSSSSIKTNGTANNDSRLIHFIQQLDIPIEKLFKQAFAIRHLRRKQIFRIIQIEEIKIKQERRLGRPLSLISDHNGSNSISTTAPIRSYNQQNSISIIMIREFDTTIASHSDFAYLWSLIPARLTEFQPERIYSSNIHGRRLRTLYDHVEFHEHCFIIIRNELEEIFGAFCSSQFSLRSKTRTWFGTGESFLFTLKPKRQVFKWIGYQKYSMGHTKPYEDYFIYADDERLQIGGSKEALDIGLCIQQDLNQGSTKQCDTYANKPLSTNEHFQIMEIEVFGFTS
ncbi:unnamed protein product [Adineta steineri]|uniref:Uncharacterized protein n=2 Tax=Adineta steineri TaxID=433720 RepID=A0A815UP58_9BILA|nr:unnamed protein product [Adineta steineri]CAF1386013.1 unnamed protein product [Adineta steineri]CAF1520258.1 unnamed protein product [Adineta steineri]CAF1520306.1 unnamed protein product [Adineta steineri]CAF1650061.1 unnamed protein product [Adineta steineri]